MTDSSFNVLNNPITKEQLVNYYLNNKGEFYQENGHERLLVELKKYIKQIDTDKQIIGLDVGSCVGDYINNFKEICTEENSRIFCFEPNPVNIEKLKQNQIFTQTIGEQKKCFGKLFECGISDQITKQPFFNFLDKRDNNAGNGIAGLRSGGEKICDVDIRTLDDVLTQEFGENDFIIKFLKIDTEGNEYNVFRGFEKYLNKTKYTIFECSDCLDDFRGPAIKNPMKTIVEFLSKHGFDTYRIGTKKLLKVNDEYWDQVYDDVKFHSNCFSIKKDDPLINYLIDNDFNLSS